MKPFPETATLDESAALTGHLWIQEYPTGGRFRFRLESAGTLTFGTANRTFDTADSLPLPYQRAARLIWERLDREALAAAVDDPADVTVFGVATWDEGVGYDWDALPAFLVTAVWSANRDAYLSPDVEASVCDRLGLPSLPAVEKEIQAAHTDLGQYSEPGAFPASSWYDGPVAGLLVRDKTGARVLFQRASGKPSGGEPAPSTPEEVTNRYVSDEGIQQAVDSLQDQGQRGTVDGVRDRLLQNLVREHHARLYAADEPIVAMDGVSSAIAERVQRYLGRNGG